MTTETMLLKDVSEKIIGAAMKVLNILRPGLDEKAYENALAIELRNRGHHIEQQNGSTYCTKGRLWTLLFLI